MQRKALMEFRTEKQTQQTTQRKAFKKRKAHNSSVDNEKNPVLNQDECHRPLRQWKERQRDEGCGMKREIGRTSDTVEEGKQRQETGLRFVV